MSIEYSAAIAEKDYDAFRTLLTTSLPGEYEMWLRVRARGKARALNERKVIFDEIDITPQEFRAYCDRMRKPDFSLATLDRCAREKALQTNRPRLVAHSMGANAGGVGRLPDVSTAPPLDRPQRRALIVHPRPSESSADGLNGAISEASSLARWSRPVPRSLRKFVAGIPPTNK